MRTDCGAWPRRGWRRCAEGQALIQKGQDALGGRDWQDAKLQLSKALATAAPELQLADLKAHADDLLAIADRRLAEQAAQEREGGRVKQFRLMADQVWFYAASTDPVAERVPYYDLRRGVAAGQAALALARAWGPGLESLPLPEERAPLKEELYDLLLLMVQARSRDCDGPKAARELLALLDEARSLHEPSRSDHRLRALCYRLLGDSSQAVEEQRRADDPRTPATALDHFLLGENDRREAITPRVRRGMRDLAAESRRADQGHRPVSAGPGVPPGSLLVPLPARSLLSGPRAEGRGRRGVGHLRGPATGLPLGV